MKLCKSMQCVSSPEVGIRSLALSLCTYYITVCDRMHMNAAYVCAYGVRQGSAVYTIMFVCGVSCVPAAALGSAFACEGWRPGSPTKPAACGQPVSPQGYTCLGPTLVPVLGLQTWAKPSFFLGIEDLNSGLTAWLTRT